MSSRDSLLTREEIRIINIHIADVSKMLLRKGKNQIDRILLEDQLSSLKRELSEHYRLKREAKKRKEAQAAYDEKFKAQ